MQSQVHVPTKESKRQNQTVQQPIQMVVEPQAVVTGHRQQSAQLEATKASMNASPKQQNLRMLQTIMNAGLSVQQLRIQQARINQFTQRIEDESPQSKFEVAQKYEQHLPHEACHTVRQTKKHVQIKAKPQHSLRRNNNYDFQRLPPPSNAVLQLKEKEVQAIEVTHLVKLNELGSLYQEDFIGNEVAETQRGDTVRIETDKVLRSRRGPNQELDPLRDKDKEPVNTWTNALAFNKRELPPESYIRDGTYEEKNIDTGIKKSKKEQAETEKRGSLLLSYDIPASEPVYLIDASHRGDMYQLRAALAVENHPLIVYNFKGENDLTNYLSNAPGVNIYKLPYNPAAPEAEDFISGRVYRSLEVLSESDATKIIVSAPQKANDIQQSMRTVPERCIAGIDEAIEKVFSGISGNVALLMYRDSGQTNWVYPELDSGEALPTLARMMQEKGFTPVFCGAPSSPPKIRNIGFYWTELDHIPKLADDEIPKENTKKFKRDIEAEFMKRAYDKGKFKIVIGFRSGALDLFTLLGIPTISIGLKNLVGEDRHSKYVGDPAWKRTNIQYDIPRSDVTRLMPGRGESTLYMSPFWKMRTTDTEQPPEKEVFPTTATAPLDFHPADLDTISKGLDIGIAKLKGEQTFNAVVMRSADHIAELPEELREIDPIVENEQIKQKKIAIWWNRQADAAVTALKFRLMHELNLISDPITREEKAKRIPELVTQESEKERISLISYLEKRTENQKKRMKSATKVRAPVPKQEPKKKEVKALPKNAAKVLQILQKALPNRISLPNSKDEEAVQTIFEMSSVEFFEAYRELARRGIAKSNEDGPYLL